MKRAEAAATPVVRPIVQAHRVVVLGSPGAGKTTLAKWLARQTGLPLYHLDDEHWGPGWSRPGPTAWERRQTELAAGDRWIIEGNYLPTAHLRTARADLVILLDTSVPRCLARVIKRAWRIRYGDVAPLPQRVREQARAGARVRATHHFLPLLRLVATFRSRHWWRAVDQARVNPQARLLVVVGPGGTARHAAALRRRLRRRGLSALVLPASALPLALSSDTKGTD